MEVTELAARVALVTGSSQGIGRAIAERLAAAGARVAVHYRQSRQSALDLATQLPGSRAYQCDLSVDDAAKELVDAVLLDYGRIDILINNAGALIGAATDATTLADWSLILKVNLTAPFLLAQHVLRGMRVQRSGVIINVASIAGLNGGNLGPAYAASKGGLIALTKYLARESAGFGVRVNAVAPTLTDTRLMRDPSVQIVSDGLLAANPMRRLARPDEVASVVAFLCSDQASFVNGECVKITGGPN